MEKEHQIRTRIALLIRALADNPFAYTRQRLADKFTVSKDTIRDDIRAIENAGFVIQRDEKHRYGFAIEKPYTQLKHLLHFTKEDQELLYRAIDHIAPHSDRARQLKKKLASLYDYHRLGHAYLRKPYLTKVDLLLQGKNERRQVILHGYSSSNSNEVRDRLVEPFHPAPPDDTLQAFDVDKRELRHFRISRITRVALTDTPWQYEGHHNILPTDPFRIVDKNQVMVHLRMRVGAYNELIERFPLTRNAIIESSEPDTYDFQCLVNHRFLGLTNFILGFHHQVIEILEPESLIEHLRAEIQKMHFL
ncbi:MAG TPA: WYL domain-containing protein [Saprospiraceae bacterium]|nr:WYL domain-containing protein [Saprospiraceae bacterium]HMP26115.1 WYL domain-containing protein [Saprospiraceae bacterium]